MTVSLTALAALLCAASVWIHTAALAVRPAWWAPAALAGDDGALRAWRVSTRVAPQAARVGMFLAGMSAMVAVWAAHEALGGRWWDIGIACGAIALLVATAVHVARRLTSERSVRGCVRLLVRAPAPDGSDPTTAMLADLMLHARHTTPAHAVDAPIPALIERAVSLRDMPIRAIMRPRGTVCVLDPAMRCGPAAATIGRDPHARYPLVDADGALAGIALARDVWRAPPSAPVATCAREAPMVPEGRSAWDVLVGLRAGTPMALVLDEYGSFAGIVTDDDLLDHLLGRVHDTSRRGGASLAPASPHLEVRGDMSVHRLGDLLGRPITDADDAGPASIGGLIAARLGRVPVVGDVVTLPGGTARVRRMRGTHVETVEVRDTGTPIP